MVKRVNVLVQELAMHHTVRGVEVCIPEERQGKHQRQGVSSEDIFGRHQR